MPNNEIPSLFLDTNIFLDFLRMRNEDSRELFRFIREGKYIAKSSVLVLMEIFEKQQEEHFIRRELVMRRKTFDSIRRKLYKKDLTTAELEEVHMDINDRIIEPYIDTELIQLFYLSEDAVDIVEDLMKEYNFTACDAVHLAIALDLECDVLVSNDDQFRENAKDKILVARPNEVKRIINENLN